MFRICGQRGNEGECLRNLMNRDGEQVGGRCTGPRIGAFFQEAPEKFCLGSEICFLSTRQEVLALTNLAGPRVVKGKTTSQEL